MDAQTQWGTLIPLRIVITKIWRIIGVGRDGEVEEYWEIVFVAAIMENSTEFLK
jgi:hypothetical protein